MSVMRELGILKHLFVTVFLGSLSGFMVIPAITDVTMEALCPGKDECSLAIYLSGFQQAVAGIGSVVMTPLIGNLSDVYGRKSLLTLPLTLSLLPLVVLAYSREKNFFYAFYALRTLAGMICEGTTLCLSLAYVADNITEGNRATSFGVLAGVGSAAFVCGTLSARFLSIAQTFQVASLSAMTATVYMRIFLKEANFQGQDDTLLISTSTTESKHLQLFKNIPTIQDMETLLKSSKTFSQVAVMVMLNSLAEGGLQASMMYFLKARFHFSKNQFADLMLIAGFAGMVSQLIFMPMLEPIMGEKRLLRIGLFMASANMFFNSVAWEVWVIYTVAVFSVFAIFTNPCMRSIASKQVGASQQGKAQGCISGINSLANIISPLIFSPLTAVFLSDNAPFYFPGFSMLCIAFCTLMAFIQSLTIREEGNNMVA